MNGREREILGVADGDGAKTLRDAVVALIARDEERERIRTELRAQDDHRWRRMETNTDAMRDDIGDLKVSLQELPCLMDAKIAVCRDERQAETADAISDAAKRRTLSSVATDWRTWMIFVVTAANVVFLAASRL